MKFQLYINTDNDAFGDTPSVEIARILHEIASLIDGAPNDELWAFRTIHDSNGNDCGRYALKPADYK